jgi:CheY-like chemotaxis protein
MQAFRGGRSVCLSTVQSLSASLRTVGRDLSGAWSCLLLFIRQAFCNLFERKEDFDVCGEAKNGKEAVEKAREFHPDLILLDLSMQWLLPDRRGTTTDLSVQPD